MRKNNGNRVRLGLEGEWEADLRRWRGDHARRKGHRTARRIATLIGASELRAPSNECDYLGRSAIIKTASRRTGVFNLTAGTALRSEVLIAARELARWVYELWELGASWWGDIRANDRDHQVRIYWGMVRRNGRRLGTVSIKAMTWELAGPPTAPGTTTTAARKSDRLVAGNAPIPRGRASLARRAAPVRGRVRAGVVRGTK